MRINPTVAVRFRLDEVLRSREELTQTDVARLAGVSLTTVNGIYHNKTAQVSLRTLDALCKVLDVEPGELLVFEDDRPRTKRRGRG